MTLSNYVLSKITAAMEIIPSNDTWPLSTGTGETRRELDEPEKIQTILGALFRASSGSSEGCELAITWCRNYVSRSGDNILEDFDPASAWNAWQEDPPIHLNVNTFFSIAESVRPGWQREWEREWHQAHSGWQQGLVEPVDLWGKFDPPLLPSGLLPEVIEQFAREKGSLMGCDPAGLAMSALAVCGAAIPDSIKLKPKRYELWDEAARIWVAVVGDPSSMKSPMMRTAAAPLVRLDTQMWRAYVDAKARYDALSREEKLTTPGGVARLVGIEVGVVSGVFNLESPGVDALGWRLRHEEAYHAA